MYYPQLFTGPPSSRSLVQWLQLLLIANMYLRLSKKGHTVVGQHNTQSLSCSSPFLTAYGLVCPVLLYSRQRSAALSGKLYAVELGSAERAEPPCPFRHHWDSTHYLTPKDSLTEPHIRRSKVYFSSSAQLTLH